MPARVVTHIHVENGLVDARVGGAVGGALVVQSGSGDFIASNLTIVGNRQSAVGTGAVSLPPLSFHHLIFSSRPLAYTNRAHARKHTHTQQRCMFSCSRYCDRRGTTDLDVAGAGQRRYDPGQPGVRG
jgi:hypothetical protein